MSKHHIFIALVCAVIVQVFVLTGMLALAARPLYTGQEIKVATLPVDPRSLFRGNYARLNYGFSELPENAFDDETVLRHGEPVYVSLKPADNGLYEYSGVSLQKPGEGVFVRGRLHNRARSRQVKYGIEAWFAPKQEALRLERELRDGAVAVLMIDSGGKAALKEIITKAGAQSPGAVPAQ